MATLYLAWNVRSQKSNTRANDALNTAYKDRECYIEERAKYIKELRGDLLAAFIKLPVAFGFIGAIGGNIVGLFTVGITMGEGAVAGIRIGILIGFIVAIFFYIAHRGDISKMKRQ